MTTYLSSIKYEILPFYDWLVQAKPVGELLTVEFNVIFSKFNRYC